MRNRIRSSFIGLMGVVLFQVLGSGSCSSLGTAEARSPFDRTNSPSTDRSLDRIGGRTIEEKSEAHSQARTSRASTLRLPLFFEENKGQTARQVRFLVRGIETGLFYTSDDVIMQLVPVGNVEQDITYPDGRNNEKLPPSSTLRMRLVGGNSNVEPIPDEKANVRINYCIGRDRERWRHDVQGFKVVRYPDVYPGIDWIHRVDNGSIRYAFHVDPGVDPGLIRIKFSGTDEITIDTTGNLILRTPSGRVVHTAPKIYQLSRGRHDRLDGGFVLLADKQVGIRVRGRDPSSALVIDPEIYFSSFFGTTGHSITTGGARYCKLSVDKEGTLFLATQTISTDIAVTDGRSHSGGYFDVLVVRMDVSDPLLPEIVGVTYLGGEGWDNPCGIEAAGDGKAFVAVSTDSRTLFTSNEAFEPHYTGQLTHAYVALIDGVGSIERATYLSGSDWHVPTALAVDLNGGDGYEPGVYVVGRTGYPAGNGLATEGAFQSMPVHGNDCFIAKLDVELSDLLYYTYLGGTLDEIPVDVKVFEGDAILAGDTKSHDFPTTEGAAQPEPGLGPQAEPLCEYGSSPWTCYDGFVCRIDKNGHSLLFSTFFGGPLTDWVGAMAVDEVGNVFLTGTNRSGEDIPQMHQRVQVAKLALDGTSWEELASVTECGIWCGSSGITLDDLGNIYVTGTTDQDGLATAGVLQPQRSAEQDAYVARLTPAGPIDYFTYLGGRCSDYGDAIAVDDRGFIYVAGHTTSPDFPIERAFQSENPYTVAAFLTIYSENTQEPAGAVLAASKVRISPDPEEFPEVEPGERVTFRVCVANVGEAEARNVVLQDNLPEGFEFVPYDPNSADHTSDAGWEAGAPGQYDASFALGSLVPGGSLCVNIVATPTIPGQFDNVTVATTDGETAVTVVAAITVSSSPAALPETYDVLELPPLIGDDASVALSINNSQATQIVGYSEKRPPEGGNPRRHAVMWVDGPRGIETYPLGRLQDFEESEAHDINDSGVAVGIAYTGIGPKRGVMWNYTQASDPFSPPGAVVFMETVPRSITENGVVVGFYKPNPYDRERAFAWDEGVFIRLDEQHPELRAQSVLYDVAHSEALHFACAVGYFRLDPADPSERKALLWIPGPPRVISLEGTHGSARSVVVTGGNLDDATLRAVGVAGNHATMWTISPRLSPPAQVTDLTPSIESYSEALGISESGIVVGARETSWEELGLPEDEPSPDDEPPQAPDHPYGLELRRLYSAFVWTEVTGMIDLNTRIGLQASNVRVQVANSINDDGEIVGEGVFNGKLRGLLLKPRP